MRVNDVMSALCVPVLPGQCVIFSRNGQDRIFEVTRRDIGKGIGYRFGDRVGSLAIKQIEPFSFDGAGMAIRLRKVSPSGLITLHISTMRSITIDRIFRMVKGVA